MPDMQPPPLRTALSDLKQILSQPWQQWFNLIGNSGYTRRTGNPAAWDFELASFTTDGTARDLDLSAIIGKGTKLVHLRGAIQDGAVGNSIMLYEPTDTNQYNADYMTTTIVDQIAYVSSMFVQCNSSGIVKYVASNTVFTGIWLLVRGWWVL